MPVARLKIRFVSVGFWFVFRF